MNSSSGSGYQSPFQQPVFNISFGGLGNILVIVFFIAFFAWVAYTLVAAYHWFRYSHSSWLAVPAIGIHVFISGLLIVYIASGLR